VNRIGWRREESNASIELFEQSAGSFRKLAWNDQPVSALGELLTRNGLQISPLVIDGLWKIMDGDGALNAPANTMYFSAGPNVEADGLFGTITPEQ
jgi:hypothetical protein